MENDYAARTRAQADRLRKSGHALILAVESSCDETAIAIVRDGREVLANCIASVFASLTANWIVFHLSGAPLLLYSSVAAFSGALCGLLGAKIVPLVRRAVSFGNPRED